MHFENSDFEALMGVFGGKPPQIVKLGRYVIGTPQSFSSTNYLTTIVKNFRAIRNSLLKAVRAISAATG